MTVLAELLALLDKHRADEDRMNAASEHWQKMYDTEPAHVAEIARQRYDAETAEWLQSWDDVENLFHQRESDLRESLRAALNGTEQRKVTND